MEGKAAEIVSWSKVFAQQDPELLDFVVYSFISSLVFLRRLSPAQAAALALPAKDRGSSPCSSRHLLRSQQMGEVINFHMFSYSNYEFALLSLPESGLGSQHSLKCFRRPHTPFLGESHIFGTITFSLRSVCIPSVSQCLPEDLGLLGCFSKAPDHHAFHIFWFASIPKKMMGIQPGQQTLQWEWLTVRCSRVVVMELIFWISREFQQGPDYLWDFPLLWQKSVPSLWLLGLSCKTPIHRVPSISCRRRCVSQNTFLICSSA